MSAFTFPTRYNRRPRALEVPNLFGRGSVAPKEVPGIINGQQARSLLEWWVAKALWKLRKEFLYQVPLFGGTQRRGGYVIDFIVDPNGLLVPLEVQGEHWHTGSLSSGERMREAIIEEYLGVELVYLWENQLTSESAAYQAVKRVL